MEITIRTLNTISALLGVLIIYLMFFRGGSDGTR